MCVCVCLYAIQCSQRHNSIVFPLTADDTEEAGGGVEAQTRNGEKTTKAS